MLTRSKAVSTHGLHGLKPPPDSGKKGLSDICDRRPLILTFIRLSAQPDISSHPHYKVIDTPLTKSQSKILKSGNELRTSSDMSANLDFNGELQPRKANPLFIPEMTDHMFQFLTLSDIKNCRLVCRQWNQLAEKFQKKLCLVHTSTPERLERFNKVFPNAQQSKIFTNFRFYYFDWSPCKFSEFCEKLYHNLSEITLCYVHFGLNEDREPYDLSTLLPSTLIKLRIEDCKPTAIISTDKIHNIRILELEVCILNIMHGATLNSVEIELQNVTFRESKTNIDNFLINPLLNFDVLKKANFSGENIILDFHGSHSLDMLTLRKDVTLLNFETSTWDIKKLSFCDYPWEQMKYQLSKSQIKYKELETSLTHLNVSFLPEGIEKLQVTFQSVGFNGGISGEHNFPDLKYLNITFQRVKSLSPFLEVFKRCPKLTNLTLSTSCRSFPCRKNNGEGILKISSVSRSVNTLRVRGSVRIIVDRSLQLESLILDEPHDDGKYNVIVQLAKELNVKNLYWFGHQQNIGGYKYMFRKKIGNNFKSLIDLNLDNFVVGPFPILYNSEFEKSYLFPLVDKKGKYYLFQRGEKGKAIGDSDSMHFLTAFK